VQKGWKELPPSRQKEIVRYVVRLKSPEAQQRYVRKALHVLAGGKAVHGEIVERRQVNTTSLPTLHEGAARRR
jgi:hypothetical protein